MTQHMIGQRDREYQQMIVDALAYHAKMGTLESPLAQRLMALRCDTVQVTARTEDAPELEGEAFPRHTVRGGQQATGSAKKTGASDAAKGYAVKLIGMKDFDKLATTHSLLHAAGQRLVNGGPIDARTCSQLIDVLKNAAWKPREAAPKVDSYTVHRDRVLKGADAPKATEAAPLEPGYYRLDGAFYRVKKSKSSGYLYAEMWDGCGWSYEDGKGKVRRITADMKLTAEDAKEFGDEYHACVFCTTQLTDQRSITVGYGPICATKNGLPWG